MNTNSVLSKSTDNRTTKNPLQPLQDKIKVFGKHGGGTVFYNI